MALLSLADLNALSQDDFVRTLGGVFEGSPWVAAGAYPARPFASLAALHAAMTGVVAAADAAAQLELLRAHPDLAGRAAQAGALSERSSAEQAGAGLNRLSPAELARFGQLNDRYRARFGFPLVLAVKGHTKESLLAALEPRLANPPEAERARALSEVYKIAGFRLEALLTPAVAP